MRSIALLTCLSAVLCAQSPTDVFNQAPPDVEKSLRDRVDQFYSTHVSGKFRQAEAVIHEDSKDVYYDSEKIRIFGWEVAKTTFSENFTQAVVITNIEIDWVMPKLGKIRVKRPVRSTWKLENGAWWWYAAPMAERETPFGLKKNRPEDAEASETTGAPRFVRPSVDSILKQVSFSKTEVWLVGYETSKEVVEITNGMPGPLDLRVDRSTLPPGLEATLSKEHLGAREIATLTLSYKPPNASVKPDALVELRADQTGLTYGVRIRFRAQPEIEKNLPRTQ